MKNIIGIIDVPECIQSNITRYQFSPVEQEKSIRNAFEKFLKLLNWFNIYPYSYYDPEKRYCASTEKIKYIKKSRDATFRRAGSAKTAVYMSLCNYSNCFTNFNNLETLKTLKTLDN